MSASIYVDWLIGMVLLPVGRQFSMVFLYIVWQLLSLTIFSRMFPKQTDLEERDVIFLHGKKNGLFWVYFNQNKISLCGKCWRGLLKPSYRIGFFLNSKILHCDISLLYSIHLSHSASPPWFLGWKGIDENLKLVLIKFLSLIQESTVSLKCGMLAY